MELWDSVGAYYLPWLSGTFFIEDRKQDYNAKPKVLKTAIDIGATSVPDLGGARFVYVNGKFLPKEEASISVLDHGLLYGDGVFEGIRAYDGVVFKLKEHVDRLYESSHYIRLDMPIGKEEMIQDVLRTLRKNNLKDAYIRLIVTRGIGELGISPVNCMKPSIIIVAEVNAPKRHATTGLPIGITTIISSIRRDPVDGTSHEVKSLNYLNSILARWEAIEAGVNESIMLDGQGFVSEASAENVFIVRKQQISTPSRNSGILHGVTREKVMDIAKEIGYVVKETEVTPFELINADEVFLTGTLSEIVPVLKVSGRVIGTGDIGPITTRICKEFLKVKSKPSEGILVYP